MAIPSSIQEFIDRLSADAPAKYDDLRAVVFNGTLKRSPEPSNTDGLLAIPLGIFEAVGVKTDVIRTVDHDIPPGNWPDMTEHGWATDGFPEIYRDLVVPADIATFELSVLERFNAWWRTSGDKTDYAAPANVYYGEQTLHEFMERSAWHAAQHTRQVQLLLETLGVAPDRPLAKEDLAGLPLPENVWDDKMVFTA